MIAEQNGAQNQSKFRAAVIGLGRMSKCHLEAIASSCAFSLVAVCDADGDTLRRAILADDVLRFSDVESMMRAAQPDLVIVVTPDAWHAENTVSAAAFRPRAIICEKPMSVDYRDAVRMVETCDQLGVHLLINHQRRISPGQRGRTLISSGIIGEPIELEAYCAGQLLSDGTHAIDFLFYLSGDVLPSDVYGAVFFSPHEGQIPQRYGHSADCAGCVFWRPIPSTGCRVFTGSFAQRTPYMQVRVRGTTGDLWLPGDIDQKWYVHHHTTSAKPRTHAASPDNNGWYLVPSETVGGDWHLADSSPSAASNAMTQSLDLLADLLSGEASTSHPLDAHNALNVQAIINAAYLSAATNAPVCPVLSREATIPFNQLTLRAEADHKASFSIL